MRIYSLCCITCKISNICIMYYVLFIQQFQMIISVYFIMYLCACNQYILNGKAESSTVDAFAPNLLLHC